MGGREKGKLVAPEGKREKHATPKEKRENTGNLFCDPIPLGNQAARSHARTRRNDFPIEHTPTSDINASKISETMPGNCSNEARH